jgi:hypothetical protein
MFDSRHKYSRLHGIFIFQNCQPDQVCDDKFDLHEMLVLNHPARPFIANSKTGSPLHANHSMECKQLNGWNFPAIAT